MPFDPNKPTNNSPNSSAEMRAQLNGLKDLIDALPTGAGITDAVIESVTTLPPGNPASATVSLVGSELRFTFALPEGATGPAGQTGSTGNDGQQGPTGAQGPPGEVSQTDLNNATLNMLSQSSNVTNNVSELPSGFSDPDAETLRLKMNELILALRR
jgi:hypothetical protein